MAGDDSSDRNAQPIGRLNLAKRASPPLLGLAKACRDKAFSSHGNGGGEEEGKRKDPPKDLLLFD